MIRRLALMPLLACALSLGSERVEAQAAPLGGRVLAAGAPSQSAAVAGVRTRVERPRYEVGAVVQRGGRSRAKPTTLMIVGGAAFLGGLLIGDDVGTAIAIGGLGVGVYGLYLYYQ